MWTVVRTLVLAGLVALLLAPALPASAQDRDVDIDIFYDELSAYGRWGDHPQWGPVWRPEVSRDWRPYTQGYWAYTEEYGWYWVSDEPWGWAAFHYGRWILDDDGDWLWIPGTEWGPAWVAWRFSDDYVGWAPLPPDADWGPDGSLVYDTRFYDEPRYASAWCFLQPRYLTTPGLYRFLAPRQQNFVILRQTRYVGGYRRSDRRVFNPGFDVRRFERVVGRPVPLMRLRTIDNPRGARHTPGGPDIPVFRPRIIDRPDGRLRRPPPGGPDRPTFKGGPTALPKVGPPQGTGPSGPPPGKGPFKVEPGRPYGTPDGRPPGIQAPGTQAPGIQAPGTQGTGPAPVLKKGPPVEPKGIQGSGPPGPSGPPPGASKGPPPEFKRPPGPPQVQTQGGPPAMKAAPPPPPPPPKAGPPPGKAPPPKKEDKKGPPDPQVR